MSHNFYKNEAKDDQEVSTQQFQGSGTQRGTTPSPGPGMGPQGGMTTPPGPGMTPGAGMTPGPGMGPQGGMTPGPGMTQPGPGMRPQPGMVPPGMGAQPGPGMRPQPGMVPPGMGTQPGPGMRPTPGPGMRPMPGPGMRPTPGPGMRPTPGPGMRPTPGPGMVPPGMGQQPRTAPPNFVPLAPGQEGRGMRIPGQFRERFRGEMRTRSRDFFGCMNSFTYLWLINGDNFWFFPTFIDRRFVQGFRWRRDRWVFDRINLNRIFFFSCF